MGLGIGSDTWMHCCSLDCSYDKFIRELYVMKHVFLIIGYWLIYYLTYNVVQKFIYVKLTYGLLSALISLLVCWAVVVLHSELEKINGLHEDLGCCGEHCGCEADCYCEPDCRYDR